MTSASGHRLRFNYLKPVAPWPGKSQPASHGSKSFWILQRFQLFLLKRGLAHLSPTLWRKEFPSIKGTPSPLNSFILPVVPPFPKQAEFLWGLSWAPQAPAHSSPRSKKVSSVVPTPCHKASDHLGLEQKGHLGDLQGPIFFFFLQARRKAYQVDSDLRP